jgi:hypothetical protein
MWRVDVERFMMKKAIMAAALFPILNCPAPAHERPPLLVESPCGWFVKMAPDIWSTDHVIRVDTWGAVTGALWFRPGMYRVDDGTDAYEFIERKCGRGAVPESVYRSAMPLPFGLLPWYQW